MYQLLITIGIVIAFLSDTWLSTYASIHDVKGGHWRMMLGILVIPSMIMFLAVSFLPRSPRWLVLKGKKEEASRVLERLRNTPAEATRELEEIEKDLAVPQGGFSLFLGNKFYRRAVFLGIVLQAIQQLTGINVVMYYAPKIFQVAGFETTAEQMWGTVLVGCTNVMATFIAVALVDRVGRKPIMYAGFTIMGLAMSTVGIMLKIGVETHHAVSFAAIAALLIFIIGFAMSAGPIIWILCSEIYPTSGRDLGITVSTATNWIVNGIVGATFLTLLDKLGSGNTFLVYGGLEVVFILIFLAYVPETKGVSLEHIAANLLGGRKLREIGR
jgi:SP family galactose:H+ symporter-like MFS transporter